MKEIIPTMLLVSVIFLMFGAGLGTSFRQLVDVTTKGTAVARGLIANFVIVPVIFAIATSWPGIAVDVRIGMLLMAASPVAPMAIALIEMANADSRYSVGLVTLAAVLCVPLTPLILLLSLPTTRDLSLNGSEIVEVVLTAQLIPIVAGMAMQRLSRTWSERLLKFVPAIGKAGLAISILLIVVVGAEQFLGLGAATLGIILLAVILALLVGELTMIGQDKKLRRSLAILTALRNPALALLIATNMFAGTNAIPVLLVYAILSVVVTVAYSLVFRGS